MFARYLVITMNTPCPVQTSVYIKYQASTNNQFK